MSNNTDILWYLFYKEKTIFHEHDHMKIMTLYEDNMIAWHSLIKMTITKLHGKRCVRQLEKESKSWSLWKEYECAKVRIYHIYDDGKCHCISNKNANGNIYYRGKWTVCMCMCMYMHLQGWCHGENLCQMTYLDYIWYKRTSLIHERHVSYFIKTCKRVEFCGSTE